MFRKETLLSRKSLREKRILILLWILFFLSSLWQDLIATLIPYLHILLNRNYAESFNVCQKALNLWRYFLKYKIRNNKKFSQTLMLSFLFSLDKKHKTDLYLGQISNNIEKICKLKHSINWGCIYIMSQLSLSVTFYLSSQMFPNYKVEEPCLQVALWSPVV